MGGLWIDLIKLAASGIAILAVAGLARWMGLGADVRIRDADHARFLAGQAVDGFEAVDVALDRAGIGALLRDAAGRQMLSYETRVAQVASPCPPPSLEFSPTEPTLLRCRNLPRVSISAAAGAPGWAKGWSASISIRPRGFFAEAAPRI